MKVPLYVYSLGKTLFEGEAVRVRLTTHDGEISILPQHMPLMTSLAAGTLVVTRSESDSETFPIQSGYAQVFPHKIVLLVE